MPKVFINYRRDDAKAEAGRISDFIEKEFGKEFVFQDVEDLNPGERWQQALLKAGSKAKVILAVIGPEWLQLNEQGVSRLADPEDWVRKELELAIHQKKTIIPILVNKAQLPDKAAIPESIQAIFEHQIIKLRTDTWNHDILRLIPVLKKYTGRLQRKHVLSTLALLLFAASAFFGNYYFNSRSQEDPSDVHKKSIDRTAIADDRHEALNETPLCPVFNPQSEIKILLFPFSKHSDATDNSEHIIKARLSSICRKYKVRPDTHLANSSDYLDTHQASQHCPTCLNDIFITGITVPGQANQHHFQAEFGFCEPSYQGLALDQDLLEIQVANVPLSSLLTDNKLENSLDIVIQVFLGMYIAKSGNASGSNQILKTVVDQIPDAKIKEAALKVIWQNDYKLDNKAECIKTLEKLEKLKPSSKVIVTKSVIQLEEKQYTAAIRGLTHAIDKESTAKLKEKYTIKRGDAYAKNKQYNLARKDYQKVEQTSEVKAKVYKVDQKINTNNKTIKDLQTNFTSITDKDKIKLANAFMENGNTSKATRALKEIDFTKLKSEDILKMDNKTISVLKANPNLYKLSPKVLEKIN